MAETYLLGGRLPLLAPGDLSDGRQQELYQRMRTHQVPWADRHNFKGMTGDDKLIGPFNPLSVQPGRRDGISGFRSGRGTVIVAGRESPAGGDPQRWRGVVVRL